MPFDNTPIDHVHEAIAVLDRIQQHLSDEKKWCKRTLVRKNGSACLIGWLILEGGNELGRNLELPVLGAIKKNGGTVGFIELYNDNNETTIDDIREVVAVAREGLVSGEFTLGQHSVGIWSNIETIQEYLSSYSSDRFELWLRNKLLGRIHEFVVTSYKEEEATPEAKKNVSLYDFTYTIPKADFESWEKTVLAKVGAELSLLHEAKQKKSVELVC